MERLVHYLMPKRRRSRLFRYGLTALIVGLFALLVFGLFEPLRAESLLVFTLPVFLAAFLFDRGSGFVATGLGALADWVFGAAARGGLVAVAPGDVLDLVIFLIVGACVATLTELLHAAVEKLVRRERELALLLREVNHRVRNDLHVATALLRLTARRGGGAEALHDAAERIGVIGRVYARLTTRESGTTVEAREFVEGLVEDLHLAAAAERPIALTARADTAELVAGCATAIGLIVNELVTNAIKHAFPGNRPGRVEVRLRREPDGLLLTVADDGVGLPGGAPQGAGLGYRMVPQLAAQIGGTIAYETAKGLTVAIRLPASCLAEGG